MGDGDLHTSSMSLSFLYVSVHSPDLLGNTSELAFRWIALLLSLQTRRLTEGSSIAPAPYSKEQEGIRETSPFFYHFLGMSRWFQVGSFPLWRSNKLNHQFNHCLFLLHVHPHVITLVEPDSLAIYITASLKGTPKNDDVKGVRVRKKHVFAAMFAGREAPMFCLQNPYNLWFQHGQWHPIPSHFWCKFVHH